MIKKHSDYISAFFEQKRPIIKLNHYYFGSIDNTPFSFAIVLPEGYGSYRFQAQIDLKNLRENLTVYFEGDHWRVHPDWVYCENPHKLSGIIPQTPEEVILQFLNYDLPSKNYAWTVTSAEPRRYENVTCMSFVPLN